MTSSLVRRIPALPVYVTVVTVLGLAALGLTVSTITPDALAQAPLLMWVFLACVIAAELAPINVMLRGREGEIVTSTAFAFAMLIAFGPGIAVPALALGGLIGDLVRRKPIQRLLFNVAQYSLSMFVAGLVLSTISEVPRLPLHSFTGADLPQIMVAGGVFFVVNTALVATVIALAQGIGIWKYFSKDFIMQASTAGLALGMSPVLTVAGEFSVACLPLLALPLVAVHRGSRQAVVNEHQALHDALTGLPNRVLFKDRVSQALESARRNGNGVVVMLMDLDHFKEINDTLGHHHGDLLLEMIGGRLEGVLRAGDTVARLGGDEFAVCLPAARDTAYAMSVAEKCLTALRTPFEIDGLDLEVGASIGIAAFPEHGDEVETLVQRADIAMYVAKTDRGGAQLYQQEQDQHSVQRLALVTELRRAIESDELVLHFQPQVDVATGQLLGVEALTRWQHPTRGLIMPDEFVPVAEATGLITPMTAHVLRAAVRKIAEWRDRGLELSVAVNLSARSFLDGGFVDEIPEILEEFGVSASQLGLEITESMIVGDPQRARSVLQQLAAMGITLAIDDFGTGYSSLAYLKQLPVHEIKIDKSFVLQMTKDASDETIVRSIIDLAHNLNLRAVAEGVEDQAVLDRLDELGCDVAQGYHVSRPLTAEALERWARERVTGELELAPVAA
jgi:diguanylate cyclase (GGDEF)-like protein